MDPLVLSFTVLGVIAIAFALAVVYEVRKRKKGGGCGSCSGCSMSGKCHKENK